MLNVFLFSWMLAFTSLSVFLFFIYLYISGCRDVEFSVGRSFVDSVDLISDNPGPI